MSKVESPRQMWPGKMTGAGSGQDGAVLPGPAEDMLREVEHLSDLAAIHALTKTAVVAIEAFLIRYRTAPSALYRLHGCEALLRVDNMLTLAMEQMLLDDEFRSEA